MTERILDKATSVLSMTRKCAHNCGRKAAPLPAGVVCPGFNGAEHPCCGYHEELGLCSHYECQRPAFRRVMGDEAAQCSQFMKSTHTCCGFHIRKIRP